MSRQAGLRGLLAAGALLVAWPAAAQEPSLAQLRAQAEAGNASAQNDLGGRLMEANDQSRAPEARSWYRRASEAGDPEGMNNYATMLLLGIGGPKDESEGRRLRTLAA